MPEVKQEAVETASKSKMDRLNNVIITSIIKGGLYGALVSIPSSFLLQWRSPTFRWFGLRGKIFYHTILIAAGANFMTERELLKFEKKMRFEKNLKRQQLINDSIATGDYLDYNFDDSEMLKVQHHGGKKKRTDVAEKRMNRDEIVANGGLVDRSKPSTDE